jgi:hypothetical protein
VHISQWRQFEKNTKATALNKFLLFFYLKNGLIYKVNAKNNLISFRTIKANESQFVICLSSFQMKID